MQEAITLLVIVGVSVVAQAVAAGIALQQMAKVAGRYRFAWGCVALALAMMVERRFAPLWRLIYSNETSSLTDAIFGLCISLLMCVGVYGLRRLFADLDELAHTDVLTGLANRRITIQHAQKEIERARRSNRAVALLMFDIDHFKQINDSHGHPAGDVVLRAVADIARTAFRRIDTVGRIGGEEFLVVLPESNREAAIAVAERLRSLIAEHEFSSSEVRLTITVSIGVVVPEVAAGTVTIAEVMKVVDNALYRAKNGGRNRVIFLEWADR